MKKKILTSAALVAFLIATPSCKKRAFNYDSDTSGMRAQSDYWVSKDKMGFINAATSDGRICFYYTEMDLDKVAPVLMQKALTPEAQRLERIAELQMFRISEPLQKEFVKVADFNELMRASPTIKQRFEYYVGKYGWTAAKWTVVPVLGGVAIVSGAGVIALGLAGSAAGGAAALGTTTIGLLTVQAGGGLVAAGSSWSALKLVDTAHNSEKSSWMKMMPKGPEKIVDAQVISYDNVSSDVKWTFMQEIREAAKNSPKQPLSVLQIIRQGSQTCPSAVTLADSMLEVYKKN